MSHDLHTLKWSFVGNPDIAVYFLKALWDKYQIAPHRVYTFPDKPVGRKQTLTPPPVYTYAQEHRIEVVQTHNLDKYVDEFTSDDFVCVFAYGAKLSNTLLDLPHTPFINIHPSLLPLHRGAAPITSVILNDEKLTGITLIEMSEEMDAGNIIGQIVWEIDEWHKYTVIEKQAAREAADLFVQAIPDYIAGDILPQTQDHSAATYTRKYTKSDMQITNNMDAYEQYRRYCAFQKPYIVHKGKRYVITQASYSPKSGFAIQEVIPEGKSKQSYSGFVFD